MHGFLEFLFWLFIAFCFVVVADFIRLCILRVIWKRRLGRMVSEMKQRRDGASEESWY